MNILRFTTISSISSVFPLNFLLPTLLTMLNHIIVVQGIHRLLVTRSFIEC